MTFEQFQSKVQDRRHLTGEGYSVAAKNLLKYFKETRQITEEQAREFERRIASH